MFGRYHSIKLTGISLCLAAVSLSKLTGISVCLAGIIALN